MAKSHADLHDLGKRFMWRCHYCRRFVHCRVCEPQKNHQQAATRDHYNPRSNGGRDRGPNIVLACWLCNSIKGASVPDDHLSRDTPRTSRRHVPSRWQYDNGR